jgi:hypothetical protein
LLKVSRGKETVDAEQKGQTVLIHTMFFINTMDSDLVIEASLVASFVAIFRLNRQLGVDREKE